MRRGVRPLEWIVVAAAVLLLGVVLFPVFEEVKVPRQPVACLSNLRQSSVAILIYQSDENERFPPRDAWMDATYPYTKTETIWHCPSVPKGVYGYAFNGALSGAKAPKDAASVPLIYDSVNPIRNASDLRTSLPLPGRHGRKEEGGGNNVGYADGHAKAVPARRVVQ